MNKKQVISWVVLAMLLVSSPAWVSRARATEEGDKNNQTNSTSGSSMNDNSDGQSDVESEAEKEDNEATQDENDEGDLNQNFDTLVNDVSSTDVSFPEVSADSLKTYGDVIAVLQVYQKGLEQLSAQADVSTAFGASLNDREKTLLQSLLKKHNTSFVQLNARIKEISDQMQGVIDLLQPMAQSDVSPFLKKLLVGMANNFKDEIQGLKDLAHQSINVLDAETTL